MVVERLLLRTERSSGRLSRLAAEAFWAASIRARMSLCDVVAEREVFGSFPEFVRCRLEGARRAASILAFKSEEEF